MRAASLRLVIVAGLFPAACAWAGGSSAAPAGRTGVSVTLTDTRRDGIDETFSLNPVMRLPGAAPYSTRDWQIDWEEEDAVATLEFHLLDSRHVRGGFELSGGTGRGGFHASNAVRHIEEFWGPETGFLSGYGASLELRLRPDRGPFLRGAYRWQTVETDHNRLVLASPDKKPNEEDTTESYLTWQQDELTGAIGWAFRHGTPLLGIRREGFELRKDIDYWIPDDGRRPIVTALNTEGAHYRYEHDTGWEPFVAAEWRLPGGVIAGGEFGLSGDRYARASVGMRF